MERIAFGLEHRDNTLETPGPRDIRTLATRRTQLKSAAIWDPAQVVSALNLLRAENPAHAKFFDASLGLYRNAKGQPVPAYLSAREVDLARAREANALNWETEHTIPYGHSSGLVAVAGDGAAEDGSPLFLPSLEPADSAVSHLIDVRQNDGNIFFSPAAGDFAIVSASAGEYVGVPAGGIARRIALAWALQSPRLLTSDLLTTPDVLILWERQIGPRLARYAPFARFGTPYPVFNGGRVYWMASGYLSAEAFPLSRAIRWDGEVSRYLRAGLVGVVDARSGATEVYLMPAPDPLSSAWARRLPEIVRPFSELPAGLAQHLRYPEGLFDVQVALIHAPPAAAPSADPRRNRPLWWSGPWAADSVSRLRIIARFEPDTANTVSGLITGTLVAGTPALDVVHFTQAADLAGPAEVVKRLADSRGVPAVGVIGTRHTVLLGDGLLSVQSAYATGNGPPRLADVIIQWGPILARGRTLATAVDGALAVPDNGGIGADWASAKRWFDRLEQARQRGDWTAFGRAYDALRRLLSGQ
jgi:hypothetical protein